MSALTEYKDSLLFEIQKEFWNERGKGARYRLTLIGTDFIAGKIKDPKDIDEIIAFFKSEGFCSDITTEEDNFSFTMTIKGCAFKDVRDGFMNKDQQPLSCPIGNVIMRAIDLQTGLAPELLPIQRDGDTCIVGVGKIASSEVTAR